MIGIMVLISLSSPVFHDTLGLSSVTTYPSCRSGPHLYALRVSVIKLEPWDETTWMIGFVYPWPYSSRWWGEIQGNRVVRRPEWDTTHSRIAVWVSVAGYFAPNQPCFPESVWVRIRVDSVANTFVDPDGNLYHSGHSHENLASKPRGNFQVGDSVVQEIWVMMDSNDTTWQSDTGTWEPFGSGWPYWYKDIGIYRVPEASGYVRWMGRLYLSPDTTHPDSGIYSGTPYQHLWVGVPGLDLYSHPRVVLAGGNHNRHHGPPAATEDHVHWLHPCASERLRVIVDTFYALYRMRLRLNHASLPWGGLFDISGQWRSPHSTHRSGWAVDLSKWAVDSTGRMRYSIPKQHATLIKMEYVVFDSTNVPDTVLTDTTRWKKRFFAIHEGKKKKNQQGQQQNKNEHFHVFLYKLGETLEEDRCE